MASRSLNASSIMKRRWAIFLNYIGVEDWPDTAAPAYGALRTHLRKAGSPIGAMDLLIAAHALTEKAVLVTDNVKEFRRVRG